MLSNTKKPLNLDKIKETLELHKYQFIKPIGSGGFASVFLVLSTKYNIEFVAKVSDFKGKTGELDTTEINSLINLSHPHIIRTYEYFTDSDYMYLILEYCEGGSLDDFVKKNGPIHPPRLYNICSQILEALKHCHDLKIAHRDIKPGNILIDKNERLKLADFGLSQIIEKKKLVQNFSGSRPYMPPEVLNRQAYDPFAADVWALGVTFFQISTGELPWNPDSPKEMRLAISMGIVSFKSSDLPHEFTAAVKKMIEVKVEKRATIEYLLSLPIFQLQAQLRIPKSTSLGSNLVLFKTSNHSKDNLKSIIATDETPTDDSTSEKYRTPKKEKRLPLSMYGSVLSLHNLMSPQNKIPTRSRNLPILMKKTFEE